MKSAERMYFARATQARGTMQRASAGLWYERALETPTSVSGLSEALGLVVEQLGFRYFMLQGQLTRSDQPGHSSRESLLLTNAPERWSEYCSRGDERGMPLSVLRHLIERISPTRWRDLPARHAPVLQTAAVAGIGTGLSCVAHNGSGQWLLASYMTDFNGRGAEDFIDANLSVCQLLTLFVHDAFERILQDGRRSASILQHRAARTLALSNRERECLTLAAAGKTAFDIASALLISERTVAFHLAESRRKLDASNTRQAVAKAMQMGMLRPGG